MKREAQKKDENVELLKEYLGQYLRAKRRERRLKRRLQEFRAEMGTAKAIQYSDMPKAPSGNLDGPVMSEVFRVMEIEERIAEQKNKVAKDLLNIMDIFDYLDTNSDERNALELHYIDGFKWERVAEEIPCSRSQVFNLQEAGLKKLLEFKRVREILKKYEAEKSA